MVTWNPQGGSDGGPAITVQPWLIAVIVLAYIGEGVALALARIEPAVIVAIYAAETAVVAPLLATARRATQIKAIAEQQAVEAPVRDAQLAQDIAERTGDILTDNGNTHSPFPFRDTPP